MSFSEKSGRCWTQETFFKRDCVKFIPSSRDLHRCDPVCQVCQNLIRCCCGRLMGEHTWGGFLPPLSLSPGLEEAETWSTELHTKASPTDAFGTIDFEDTATRVCRAKYIRVAADTKAEMLLQLMLKEWQMERPKLLLSIQGGSENFTLPPKVMQAFSRGLMAAALSTGAWILTEGISTGVSKYVGEAVRTFGSHSLRSRNTVGITPWGVIHSNTDLIGRDVFKPYQPLANPLGKRACLNGFHSHFLLVDDGTVGKHGCQQGLRKSLEKHIQQQKIHPRLKLGVPVVCVVVEGGPNIVSAVLDCVQSVPPVPVFVFEGSGKAADLLAFLHKHTATDRQLHADFTHDLLIRVQSAFGVESSEASELCGLLQQCMDHRQSITVYDSESEDLGLPDAAILTSALKGTTAGPAEQLSMTLAWNRADLAQKHILVSGQHWKVGSLEQALLDALVMDRVGFVKLLIDNGMTMSRFLTVNRLEELYNTPQSGGQTDRFLRHLVEDVKQTSLPEGYRLSIIDVGLVMEYLMGGAYCSTYTRKPFRAVYSRLQKKKGRRESWTAVSKQRHGLVLDSSRSHLHFFRTAQPYKPQQQAFPTVSRRQNTTSTGPCEAPPLVAFNFNDLFVWAVLQQRQQMALFLWPRGEEALARATAACQLYRSMAFEARRSSMDDSTAERLRTCSLEFGQLAVDLLDVAFHQNEQMAMKLLTSEMEAWSHFTCLQMAVSSCHRPFVSHSCTQTLLTDLWSGPLNMRKNSSLKIILSLILPPAILLLEFKSKAEMCHVPQSYETMLFGLDPAKSESSPERADQMAGQDSERGPVPLQESPAPGSLNPSWTTWNSLSWMKRLLEFYTAPVVKFWFHTMFYLGFLMLFSYVVLVKMEEQPSAQEWLLISYMVSTALEKTREVLMSEPRKLSHKLKVWFSEYWNVSDFLAILLFLAGLALRWHPEPYRTAGRISYCLDLIFWFIRSMDLLAVNQHAGPYLTIITKMTRNMFFIVVMMAIVLLSFGVSRKAILSPNSEPSWSLARDVVFQPYWMIYGEVYASEMDVCDGVQHCPPAAFLSPLLQAVYMFLQYIIMVNILIAFVNNIYFDMAATSNKLWKYNRYRYIMTYQDRPWLPPPMVLLSHVVLLLRTICRRCRGAAEGEEGGTGLKLFLGCEDRKLLHEFEEKCVEAYFQEKSNDASSNQMNRIRTTAERVEEMNVMVEEVSEKVNFIQDSLLELDSQLGHLQDLSALAVDTLTMLSASDSQLQEEVRLSQCQPPAVPWHVHPHSWTQSHRDGLTLQAVTACRSSPLSLLKNFSVIGRRRASPERHIDPKGGRVGRPEEEGWASVQGSAAADQTSCEPWDLSSWNQDSSHAKLWTCDPNLLPNPEEISMEEEEEEEDEDGLTHERLTNVEGCAGAVLSTPCGGSGNPAFVPEDNAARCHSRISSQWRQAGTLSKWGGVLRGHPYGHCRSLSSSMENITFSSTQSPKRTFRDEASLQCSRSRDWSEPYDFAQVSGRGRGHNRKTVKIQESKMPDAFWRRRAIGEAKCWSASASLSQLYLEPLDIMQKTAFSHQDVWSPPHSEWKSWVTSMSRRSSLQGGAAPEVKGSWFQSSETLYPHYSAVERNNLMRLATSIPFTPVSILGGEEVSIYSLEELPSDGDVGSTSISSWASRGLSAILQPLSSAEGSLDGGLRQGCRVLCTWAEQDVLRPGLVYVVKAFRPEVLGVWQQYFHGSTSLQLCLREIQQQRAAQKLMQVFNRIRPRDLCPSPSFLDVSLLLCPSSGHWFTIERNMCGEFRKYNNNSGEEIAPCCSLEELLLAFSHWTFEYSHRELLVLDIQGVGEALTDPTVIMAQEKRGEMLFGPDNLGDVAIKGFLQRHCCRTSCSRLGLTGLRKNLDRCEETAAGTSTSV